MRLSSLEGGGSGSRSEAGRTQASACASERERERIVERALSSAPLSSRVLLLPAATSAPEKKKEKREERRGEREGKPKQPRADSATRTPGL